MQDKRIVYGLAIAVVVLLGAMSVLGYLFYKSSEKLGEVNNVLSARVDEIQAFDRKLGISESNLRLQKDLTDKYEKEIENFDDKFLAITKKYDLDLKSRDHSIAELKGKANPGNSTVTIITSATTPSGEPLVIEVTKDICSGNSIAYEWEDKEKRFKLKDPDIFEKGNETFEYKQHFIIKGYVFTDETGDVQVKKVELQEVLPPTVGGRGNGTEYIPVDGSNITLVSSKFEYTNKTKNEKSLLDMVTFRPIASFDTAVTPGFGLELINVGRYFDYINLGLYSKLAFDVSDPLGGSLQNSRMGLGVSYHLLPPFLSTNFAVGASISTPFNNLGQPVFTLDVILYLTDDLNPLQWLK